MTKSADQMTKSADKIEKADDVKSPDCLISSSENMSITKPKNYSFDIFQLMTLIIWSGQHGLDKSK